MRKKTFITGAAILGAMLSTGTPAEAGFGLFGGAGHGAHGSYGSGGYGSGGSSGGVGYGSSGGYGLAAAGYGSSGGGYGSSGGGFGSSGGGFGSTGAHHMGPLKRLAAKIHAHHAARVAARHSSGGSSGGFGSSGSVVVAGPAYGSYGGSSGGSSGGYGSLYAAPAIATYGGSSGGSSGGTSYSHPIESYMPMSEGSGAMDAAPPAEPTPDNGASIRGRGYDAGYTQSSRTRATQVSAKVSPQIAADSALLTVVVPESAKVVVNGRETTSTGAVRQFTSNGLKPGYGYTYEVQVTFEGQDEPVTKQVKLRAGISERLVFDAPKSEEAVADNGAVETVVTLRVPQDAEVTLAGNQTRGEGENRTFRTRQLSAGETWDGYTIRVTTMINGNPVSQERTIDLVAGSTHDFAFDFDAATIASR